MTFSWRLGILGLLAIESVATASPPLPGTPAVTEPPSTIATLPAAESPSAMTAPTIVAPPRDTPSMSVSRPGQGPDSQEWTLQQILPETESREVIRTRLAAKSEQIESFGAQLRDIAVLVQPSVVQIEVRIPAPKGSGIPTLLEKGSGVLVRLRNQNVVLTNNHVLQRSSPERIRIQTSGGGTIRCDTVLCDPETDIAVLLPSTDTVAESFQPAELSTSPSETGDFVCSFGHPFGLEQSLALGVVGGLGRCQLKLAGGTIRYQYFIQTDAPLNPGSSGGPLVNLRGEVVGLATGIASSSGGNNGIGFAIPIHLVVRIADQLLAKGSVERGWLGIQMYPTVRPDQLKTYGLTRPVGAIVREVNADSPAAKAGIVAGDLLLRYDGDRIERPEHVTMLAPLSPPETMVTIDLLRGRTLLRLRVTTGKRP